MELTLSVVRVLMGTDQPYHTPDPNQIDAIPLVLLDRIVIVFIEPQSGLLQQQIEINQEVPAMSMGF